MGIDQTMSDFDQMQYQAKAVQLLARITQTKKIPNALLFSGNINTGKKQAAFLFAKGCNCIEGKDLGCSSCNSCCKIDANSHPDIRVIDLVKEKKNISISQIREMASSICTKPNEAKFRMVLILNSDTMNTQAQNALLKMLEEPPEKTFFILTTSQESRLLPTIRSRCQDIVFKPLSDTFIEQYLKKHFKIDDTLCHIASRTAGSDLKKAMMYSGVQKETTTINWVEKRKWLLVTLEAIVKSNPQQSISKGLMLSAHLSNHKNLMNDSIAIITTFFRDLMVFKFHPKKIVNLDFYDTFADINQKIPQNVFLKWSEEWIQTEKRVLQNSSIRLTLDRFFLKIVTNKGHLDI